jgi:hypothetical protein
MGMETWITQGYFDYALALYHLGVFVPGPVHYFGTIREEE